MFLISSHCLCMAHSKCPKRVQSETNHVWSWSGKISATVNVLFIFLEEKNTFDKIEIYKKKIPPFIYLNDLRNDKETHATWPYNAKKKITHEKL